jgi:uncharacterized protein YfkK (UPF0435 family)
MIKRNIDQKLNCLCHCVFYSEQKNNDSSNSDDVTLTHDPVEYKGIYSESNRIKKIKIFTSGVKNIMQPILF